MRTLAILFLATMLFSSANAQTADAKPKQPSPEEMKKFMDQTMDSLVTMAGKTAEVAIEAQLRVADRPETAERIAAFKRNLYNALLKQGFNQQDALKITSSTGIPNAMTTGK